MNTNMIRFRIFFLNLCVLVFWMNLASALEGLKVKMKVKKECESNQIISNVSMTPVESLSYLSSTHPGYLIEGAGLSTH